MPRLLLPFGVSDTGPIHDDEILGKAYDARLARRLLRYARPYWGLVAASLALLLIDGALQLTGPLLTRYVIDVAVPAADRTAIVGSALAFLGALAGQSVCSYGETLLTARLGQGIMHDLRTQLFAHVQRLPVAYFDRTPVGRLVTRVTSDIESLNELFTSGVVAGLGDLFTLLAISILMIAIDWRLALAAFAVIPFILLVSNLFRVHVRRAYRDIRVRVARINAYLQERLTGMRVVQLFGEEQAEAKRFDGLNRDHLQAQLRSITVYALYFPLIEILTTVAVASLLVAGARRTGVGDGALSVGTVAAFLQLVRRFFDPLQDLSDKYNTLQQAMASSERVFKVMDEPSIPEPVDRTRALARRPSPVDGVAAFEPVTIEFEDVWFAYDAAHIAADGVAPSEPQWVLKAVSFRVTPGNTLALVGHTGAGKTTIVSLILRFYDPQRGRILLNGVDVRTLTTSDVRERIGYVQQDIFLFAGDIASNIRLSSPTSEESVAAALSAAGATRIIARTPKGTGRELGERGASLSVGERQLLSFARAVAANPSLLILDEATSAVDSEIESEIQRAVEVLMRGRTTIAIAHRLSTIVRATEILVLHHGEVRERGTHRQLMASRGLYERLYRLQIGALESSTREGR
ncbi:MAG: putative ABC transporter ATP-binding protein [Gemmatimonadaceae bacterium]|nr:putative ABC transporter ATP-binding protein [Gemmatimonadaceae bacterium]